MGHRKVFIPLSVVAVCGAVLTGMLLVYGAEQEAGEREAVERREARRGALEPRQEAKALEFLRQYFPHELEELQRARREKPFAYADRLREAFFEAAELEELKRLEPQDYALRVERMKERADVRRLAMETKKAPPERRAALEKELRKKLGRVFDRRQLELEDELREVEERLIEFREEVRLHKISRYAVIQERLAEYLRAAEPVRW